MGKLKEAIGNIEWDTEFEDMTGMKSMDKFYMILDREICSQKDEKKGKQATLDVQEDFEDDQKKEEALEKLQY